MPAAVVVAICLPLVLVVMFVQISHDAYSCAEFPNSKSFPSQRPFDYQHVGQVSYVTVLGRIFAVFALKLGGMWLFDL